MCPLSVQNVRHGFQCAAIASTAVEAIHCVLVCPRQLQQFCLSVVYFDPEGLFREATWKEISGP
jgi:hypothetical protein